jgi:hypothetical protein
MADEFDWMPPERADICRAVATILAPQIEDLTGKPDQETDVILSAAMAQAGYSKDDGADIEICAWCGTVFHTAYGHEWLDPLCVGEIADLCKAIGVKRRVLRRLAFQHFCGFDHLRDAAWAKEAD